MASNNFLQTISIFLCPFILCIISHIPQSASQPNSSPQNIQTFYPFAAPPLATIPPLPPPRPPNLLPPPPALIPPPRKSSTRSAVGKAIGATAATTLVVSGLVFFLVLLYSRRRNRKDGNATTITDTASSAMPPQGDSFTRFSGNLKGVIVDENGLDVLYWRNLHDGENKSSSSFKKQSFKNIKDSDDHEDKDEQKGSKREHIHDVPLLRGKSSTSQSVVWGQKQDPITLQKPPSIPSRMPSVVEVSRDSPLQLVQQSPALPPRQPSLGIHPKGKMPAPELPPSPPRTSLAMPRTKSEDRRFSGDLMEAMFGYVATRRKSPKRDRSGRSSSQVSILNVDRSHQTTAVIKSLSVTHREIINAVDEGRGLNADTIEKLVSIAPNEEEVSRILAFTGDPTRLADPESFLHHLLTTVPSTFARLNVMRLRSKYELEVSRIKEDLESLESACKEIRAPGLFPKLLEAVLKAGNRLLSNAQAFDIAALKKLSGVKSSDGRTTLLQFVVQEVVRAEGKRRINNKDRGSGRNSGNLGSQSTDQSASRDDREREYMRLGLPIIAGLSAEFPNVKKAAMLNYDVLSKTGSTLEAHVAEIQQMLAQCSPDGPFARAVKGFINTAELEMKILMEDQDKAIELAKKTIDYYPSGTLRKRRDKENPLQVFVIMRDFLQMVDQVCADISMDVEGRRPATSSTSSPSLLPESPRVFRFPKLPPSFMADDHEDESDLQVR